MTVTRSKRTGARTGEMSSNTLPDSVPQSTTEQATRDNTDDPSIPPGRPNTRSKHISQEVAKDAPLTNRGARRTRRNGGKSGDGRATESTGHLAGRPQNLENTDDVDDVEAPRRERVDFVVVPLWARTLRHTIPGKKAELKGSSTMDITPMDTNSDPLSLIDHMVETIEPTTIMATTMDDVEGSALGDRLQDSADQDGNDINLDKFSPLLSALSISSPPSPVMFDQDDHGYDEEGAPWLMVFDSDHLSSRAGTRGSMSDYAFTDLDLEYQHRDFSEPGQLTHDNNHGQDGDENGAQEDDDPFGFFKVERRLQRTKDQRPKIRAINETNHRSMITTTASSKSASNDSAKAFRERLDYSVLERAAARRRGDVKGKGKAIDRAPSSDISQQGYKADRSQSNTASDLMDEDLQKAIRLSRGLDVQLGEGSSSDRKSNAIQPSSSVPDAIKDSTTDNGVRLAADAPLEELDDEETLKRNHRRISRLYGRTALIETEANEAETQGAPLLATNGTAGPSRGVEVSGNDDNEAVELLSPSTLPENIPNSSRLSIGSDDFQPIEFDTTPKRRPEAGVPLSMDLSPSSTGTKDKRHASKKSQKYLPTEQLEAMLPRRPRRVEGISRKRRTEEDESSSSEDERDEIHGSNRKSASAARRNKEKGTTAARQESRKKGPSSLHPSTPSLSTGSLSKKRRTVVDVEASAPMSKRSNAQPDTYTNSSKSNAKSQADASGWNASQIAAHQERINYFKQVDDFELDVETV
ncbi:hypothetical protein BGX31_008665 [Mortierella sp. GBA43]|nr:hypothetical protein BGX31_008665 [Mortierella sp. GBA43]